MRTLENYFEMFKSQLLASDRVFLESSKPYKISALAPSPTPAAFGDSLFLSLSYQNSRLSQGASFPWPERILDRELSKSQTSQFTLLQDFVRTHLFNRAFTDHVSAMNYLVKGISLHPKFPKDEAKVCMNVVYRDGNDYLISWYSHFPDQEVPTITLDEIWRIRREGESD
jgi:hypothetical protein